MESVPVGGPVFIVVIEPRLLNVFEFLYNWGLGGVVALEVVLSGPLSR